VGAPTLARVLGHRENKQNKLCGNATYHDTTPSELYKCQIAVVLGSLMHAQASCKVPDPDHWVLAGCRGYVRRDEWPKDVPLPAFLSSTAGMCQRAACPPLPPACCSHSCPQIAVAGSAMAPHNPPSTACNGCVHPQMPRVAPLPLAMTPCSIVPLLVATGARTKRRSTRQAAAAQKQTRSCALCRSAPPPSSPRP
jgi:hypothetical protein